MGLDVFENYECDGQIEISNLKGERMDKLIYIPADQIHEHPDNPRKDLGDGTIGDEQYYYGLDEVAAVYIFTSADANQLRQDGTKRLKDLQNYKKCQMTIEDVDLEIGDIVAGYDEVTDTTVMKPIKKKILKINDGQLTIDYEVKGDD